MLSTFFSNVASQRLSAVSSLTSSFWIFAGLATRNGLPAAWNALMYARLYHLLSSLSTGPRFIISYEFNVFKVNPHDVPSDLGIGTLTCKIKTSKNCRLDRAIGDMKLLWHPVTLSCNSRPTWTHLQILALTLSIAFHLCLFCAFGSLLPVGIPPGTTYTDLSARDTIAGGLVSWPCSWYQQIPPASNLCEPHSPGNSDLQLRSICNFLIKDRQCRHLQWLGLINVWPEFKHYILIRKGEHYDQ